MGKKGIGFRVSCNEIFYAIIDYESQDDSWVVTSLSSLIVPKALDFPHGLTFIRTTIMTLLKQYGIEHAGIKQIEGNARSSITNNLLKRVNIEGVIQEVFSTSSVTSYFIGVTKTIICNLGSGKQRLDELAEQLGLADELSLDSGLVVKPEYMEAFLVALATLRTK